MKDAMMLTTLAILLASQVANAQSEKDFAGQPLLTVSSAITTSGNDAQQPNKMPALRFSADRRDLQLSLRHRSGATFSLGPRGLSFTASF